MLLSSQYSKQFNVCQGQAGRCFGLRAAVLTYGDRGHGTAAAAAPALARPSTGRYVATSSVATESITGRPVLLDSYDEAVFEPSNDLRELAAAQLQSLFQVLRRLSPSPSASSSCKACVYARRADSLDAPQIKLQRVACCKSSQLHTTATLGYISSSGGSPGSNNSFEELDEVLVLHRSAWEPGSSNGSGGTMGCETEALLINEEVVLLPSSNLLVLPLAEAGVLVGLLVVEVLSAGAPQPYQPQPLQQQAPQGGQPAWELPPVLGLCEDVLWALRMSVPPLAKACAMDMRTALAGAQQEARQRLARSLLLEARGPLKVLDTFGQLLSPRLRTGQTGEPESDMADGMLLQGQRLADVVAQLEAALRPPLRAMTGAGLDGSSSSSRIGGVADPQLPPNSSSSSSILGPSRQQHQQPWRQPLPLPPTVTDDGDVSDEDDSWAFADTTQQHQQQQQFRTAANSSRTAAPAAQAVQPQHPLQVQHSIPASSSPSHSRVRPKLLGPGRQDVQQPQQQPSSAVVDLVPGQHRAEALVSSSRNIRWRAVETPTPKQLPMVAQHKGPVSMSSSSSSSTSVYAPCLGSFDAAKTIELEPQLLDDNEAARGVVPDSSCGSWARDRAVAAGSDAAVAAADSAGPVERAGIGATAKRAQEQGALQQQPQQQRPGPKGSCNVVEVLSTLLSAAADLARMQGIHLIVNDPLMPDPPLAGISNASSTAQQRRSTSSTALTLLPRPVRPLMVAVAANVCRRALGYCIDVTLQCTPRGGQVCVTARAGAGGVEVSFMHTGRAQPDRLHTSSAAFDAAAVAAPPVAAMSAAGGTAVMPRVKRRRVEERGSSSSGSISSGNGSSRWSAGLQELASSGGLRGGSRLITLDFARQLLQSVGGRLSLSYPCHFVNALSGQLEVGSHIEVWLPAPSASAG